MAKAKTKSKAKKSKPAKKSAAKTAKKPAAKPAKQINPDTGHAGTQTSLAPLPVGQPPATGPVLRGLRTVIYQVDDLARAKAFYSTAIGRAPYFDEPYYVGYDVGGFELGLDPDLSKRTPGPGGAIAYWRVDDLDATHGLLVALGARSIEAPHNVGGPIAVAVLADPFGNFLGLITGA